MSQAQTQQEQRVNFQLTNQMLQVIHAGLQQLPYGQSAAVIDDLSAQVAELNKQAQEQAADQTGAE